jgi:hypothetical protein
MVKNSDNFWNSSSGDNIKSTAKEGLKWTGRALIIGLSLGLATKAFNSVSD